MSGGNGGKLEVERKYSVGPGFAVPDLSGLPGVAEVSSPRTYHLTAVYLDTPGFRLASARITLRRRTGGTAPGGTSSSRPVRPGARCTPRSARAPAPCRLSSPAWCPT